MTSTFSTSNYERHLKVLQLIERQRRVSINQICEAFSISMATARRDLEVLAEEGKIKRIHGGAVATSPSTPEPPILQRVVEQVDEKARIGRAAAELVGDGETIFLGSGTTVLEVAHNLLDRRNLTVITNSLLVINALADAEISLISLGGFFRRSEMSLIGHIAEQALSEVRADKVIMGIRAVDVEQGLTNDYVPETMTDRAIMNIGKKIILVADHTKCGRVSAAFVAPITAVHVLVTDNAVAPDFVEAVSAKNIHVVTC